MKRIIALCATLVLSAALSLPAFAADVGVCYPTAIEQSEDGHQLKRIYDLTPETDPAGIPRSDFERGGFRYTLVELLRQELPAYEERQHIETVSLPSDKKDMESVLALLPQEREFVTEDGLTGTLTLRLDTVRVEASGYGSSTKRITATRSYPNLVGQDTQYIPKSIEDGGRTLTLETIDWQTDNTASVDGYAIGDRYTAVATYAGTATSSYVKGYTVTADYRERRNQHCVRGGETPCAGDGAEERAQYRPAASEQDTRRTLRKKSAGAGAGVHRQQGGGKTQASAAHGC